MAKSAAMVRRLVVKVGASVLTDESGRIQAAHVKHLVGQVAEALRPPGRSLVLVSSGAIACGMAALKLRRRPRVLAQLQACAAIGQGELMRQYSQLFGERGLTVAQVLLTQSDLADSARCRNAKNTLRTLLAQGVVPIVNENDTVAVEELTFGDNDRLAALVACLVEAELLVILSDVDGLLHQGRVIERIDRLDQRHQTMVMGAASRETTTGGMASKLAAARVAGHAGIPLVIANGTSPQALTDLLAGKPVGTLIAPPNTRLAFRKWWIAFSARKPLGRLSVDAGAATALLEGGKSLLASGVRAVDGRFHAGDSVMIVDPAGREIARGLSRYSSGDLLRIQGMRSDRIAQLLGGRAGREVVHRDNLVLTHGL